MRNLILALLLGLTFCSLGTAQFHLYTLPANSARDLFGYAVAGAGDWDGDGVPDIAASGFINDNSNPPWIDLRIFSGSNGRQIRGYRGGDAASTVLASGDVTGKGQIAVLGNSADSVQKYTSKKSGTVANGSIGAIVSDVDVAGDVNKDGTPDVIVGWDARRTDYVAVFDGTTRRVIWRFNIPANEQGQFGHAVAGVGDLDGDGYADFAFSNPLIATAYVDVHSGKTGKRLHRLTGQTGNRFGWAIASVGDIDNDKVPDIAVSEPRRQVGRFYLGAVAVYSGKTGRLVRRVFGPTTHRTAGDVHFGHALIGLGDVDGDKVPDLAISNPGPWWSPTFQSAAVTVVGSGTGRVIQTYTSKDRGFGFSLASAGDVNGDGAQDLLIGVPWHDSVVGKTAGSVRVVSTTPLLMTSNLHEADTTKTSTLALQVFGGKAAANQRFLIAGTTSGTKPGIRLGRFQLPLNYDSYTSLTLASPTQGLPRMNGALDQNGRAAVFGSIPANALTSLKGTQFHHICIVYRNNGAILKVSRPLPLRLF